MSVEIIARTDESLDDAPIQAIDRANNAPEGLTHVTYGGISVSTKSLIAAVACAVMLSGCATPPTQEQAGMVIGGAIGGILGSQVGGGSGRTAAIIVGTLAGAAIGGAVGHSMDESDRVKTAHALESVRTGVPSQWRNPDTGNQYTVVPTRTYDTAQGPCREYTVDAVIAGRQDKVYGSACRQPDGSWRATG